MASHAFDSSISPKDWFSQLTTADKKLVSHGKWEKICGPHPTHWRGFSDEYAKFIQDIVKKTKTLEREALAAKKGYSSYAAYREALEEMQKIEHIKSLRRKEERSRRAEKERLAQAELLKKKQEELTSQKRKCVEKIREMGFVVTDSGSIQVPITVTFTTDMLCKDTIKRILDDDVCIKTVLEEIAIGELLYEYQYE